MYCVSNLIITTTTTKGHSRETAIDNGKARTKDRSSTYVHPLCPSCPAWRRPEAWNTGRAASCPDMAAAVRQGDQRDRRSSATGNYTPSVRDSLPGISLLTRVLLTPCLYKPKWRAVRSIAPLSGWSVCRYSARSSKVQRMKSTGRAGCPPGTGGRASPWRLSQSSSSHEGRFHLGFSSGRSYTALFPPGGISPYSLSKPLSSNFNVRLFSVTVRIT